MDRDLVSIAVFASLLAAVVAVLLLWRRLQAERAARRADAQAKADFLAMMNHELRTPLHGWLALVDLLEATVLDIRQRHYAGLMRRAAHHLDHLASTVLEWSDSGKLPQFPIMAGEGENPALAVPGSPAIALPAGCRLLFADDVELNRLVLREFLAGTGAQMDEAADGVEALAKLETGRYDLAILDLRMPNMDGFAAAQAIRQREGLHQRPSLPLVALSAGGSVAERQRATAAGFTVFLAKPIGRAALLAALADVLGPLGGSAPRTVPLPNIPEGLEHMLPLFVAEMDKDAVVLAALDNGPADALAEHVHAMRGKCAMFGEDILFDLLTRLEDDTKAGRSDRRATLLADVVERTRQLSVYGSPP